jgi:hypothetical protein
MQFLQAFSVIFRNLIAPFFEKVLFQQKSELFLFLCGEPFHFFNNLGTTLNHGVKHEDFVILQDLTPFPHFHISSKTNKARSAFAGRVHAMVSISLIIIITYIV